jgi:glutamine amidotransferase
MRGSRVTVGIADLGIGNFAAMEKMVAQVGGNPRRLSTPDDIDLIDRLILPGVGAFDYAAAQLDERGWREPLLNIFKEGSVPVLAVCVGMELLLDASDEGPGRGLGWIPGRCRRFDTNDAPGLKVPHMGWNEVSSARSTPFFTADTHDRFYFVHSYYADVPQEYVLATATYGRPFPAAIARGSVTGVQFHPEKSHRFGLRLISNFLAAPC